MLQVFTMSLDSVLVSAIMSKDVKTEVEEQDIGAILRLMDVNDIGSVVIVKRQDKEQIPVGIITERDIVRTLGRKAGDLKEPLTTFMSKPIISIQSNSSAREAMQLMNSNHIRIVVLDLSGKIVGILTEKDIFREMLKKTGLVDDFTKYG
ncbi:MAG: CBS domain-containing protein [Nitrosopumilales archaeon]|nr:MAG: CBS domain-containing protein [Nitrosopumilales archaeon]